MAEGLSEIPFRPAGQNKRAHRFSGGRLKSENPSPPGVGVIAQAERKVESIASDERKKQPRSGEMGLGGGVSPRSSGKRNEPQSGDTRYSPGTAHRQER
jgi:hypothetical protein